MKKLITLILLASTLTTFAQRNSGFRVGYNIGWVSSTQGSVNPYYENELNIGTLNTLHLGYSWNIRLGGKYSLQTDLLYERKGYSYTVKNTNYEPVEMMTDMISLPITLNYAISPHLYIELGAGYSMGEKIYGGMIHEFSIVTGLCYSTNYVDLSLRYIHGLTPIDQTNLISGTFNNEFGTGPFYNSSTNSYTEKFRTVQISLTLPVFKHIKKVMHRE